MLLSMRRHRYSKVNVATGKSQLGKLGHAVKELVSLVFSTMEANPQSTFLPQSLQFLPLCPMVCKYVHLLDEKRSGPQCHEKLHGALVKQTLT